MVVVETRTERLISSKVNLTATVPPTVTDDANSGYELMSVWLDTTTDRLYFASNVTVGAAVWRRAGSEFEVGTGMATVTASVTQTQGQQALVGELVVVTTVANANDVVTLPAASIGAKIKVINQGANTLQVFPASGDDIDGGATDASVTIAPSTSSTFQAIDAASWYS